MLTDAQFIEVNPLERPLLVPCLVFHGTNIKFHVVSPGLEAHVITYIQGKYGVAQPQISMAEMMVVDPGTSLRGNTYTKVGLDACGRSFYLAFHTPDARIVLAMLQEAGEAAYGDPKALKVGIMGGLLVLRPAERDQAVELIQAWLGVSAQEG